MLFYFPPQVHILRLIKNQNHLLGMMHNNNSYIIGMMNGRDAVYLTRVLSNKAVGTLHDYKPLFLNDYNNNDRSSLYLHDKIRLSITKEADKPEFDWLVEPIGTHELLEYPRRKYMGLVLPTEKINETKDTIEFLSLVIEPVFDPKHFTMDIDQGFEI